MDSSRFIQLFLIALFSAAVAVIGLNELSHRFMRTAKIGEIPSAQRLVKELSGEVSVTKPLEGKPTPSVLPESGQPSGGQAAYGAVQSGAKRLVDKLLP